MTFNRLDAIVFVYRHTATGEIRAEYSDAASECTIPEYEHIATLEPRAWIQAHYDEVKHD